MDEKGLKTDHDKGKGKSAEEPTVASRVATSAARLASDAIKGQVKSGEITAAHKAESSGSAAKASQSNGAAALCRPPDAKEAHASPFRSSAAAEHAAREEASFLSFLDSTEQVGAPPLPVPQERQQYQQRYAHGANHKATYAMGDGAEVVRLLDKHYDQVLTTDNNDGDAVPLTDHERTALQQALFQPGHNWEAVLDFYPDFSSESQRMAGIADSDAARITWAAQWQDVLTCYTDAVWGDLGPLVDEARTELNMISSPISSTQPKALRRLQQILVQLRGS